MRPPKTLAMRQTCKMGKQNPLDPELWVAGLRSGTSNDEFIVSFQLVAHATRGFGSG